MAKERKSKRVLWEIMLRLEEAGEEDICSLLNEVMGAQPYCGSGVDLAEFIDAIVALETQSELQLREYEIKEGRTVFGDLVQAQVLRSSSAFSFDSQARIWNWGEPRRILVEVPDG